MIRLLCSATLAAVLASAPFDAHAQSARSDRVEAAAAAREASDYDQAREILQSLLRDSPKDADLLRRLAMVEADDGNLDRALQRIDAATRLTPDDIDIALARAYILFWRGEAGPAQEIVAGIEARKPAYPDLAPLQNALTRDARQNGPHLRALSVASGLSDITLRNGTSRTWNSQNVVVALDLSRSDTASFTLNREDRGLVDYRLGARIDHRLRNGSWFVAATAVIEPDFQESWSLAGGGELIAARGVTGLLDMRVAHYDTGTIVAVQPGVRLDLGHDVSITGRAINILGGEEDYRLGSSLRLDYRPERGASLFAIAASYPDAEADDVRQLRSGAAGFAAPLNETLSITAAASYEDRDNSYRRWSGTLALTYRFRPR